MRGEIYCSTRCAREAARHPLWRRLRGPLSRPVSPWIAIAAVALAGIGPVILALHTVTELDRLHAPGPFPSLRRASEGARLEEVVETADGTRLAGRAENGQAVFLYAAGRLVGSSFVEGGRFRFDGVREKGPYGVRSMPVAGGPQAAAPRTETAEGPPVPSARPAPTASVAIAASLPKPTSAAPEALPDPARVPVVAPAAPPAIAAALPPPAARPRSARPAATPTPETRLSIRFSPPRTEPAAPPASSAAPPAIPDSPAPVTSAAEGIPPDLTRGPTDRPQILVSFDAGSSDRGASQILDALSSRGIRTTVFLTGEFIRRYPALVRRIAQDGHEVGNHTDTHPHLTTFAADGRQVTRPGVDRAFIAGELARTARLYRDTTGLSMAPLWRAPFGEHNPQIRRWAAEQGYWHVGWTGGRGGLDGLDWISSPGARGYQSAEALLKRLVRHADNGGIVLLHLGSDRSEPVAERIDVLLDGLKARRFELVRASDFLSREGLNAERLASFRQPAAAR
ncbi:MAG TPA: polysaccharide deacetylase family protein [Thermoanaerobaculia bacterium]|nr:polysaccharide deacetylase family protein [Thermoanaerobaculia bacterium]